MNERVVNIHTLEGGETFGNSKEEGAGQEGCEEESSRQESCEEESPGQEGREKESSRQEEEVTLLFA